MPEAIRRSAALFLGGFLLMSLDPTEVHSIIVVENAPTDDVEGQGQAELQSPKLSCPSPLRMLNPKRPFNRQRFRLVQRGEDLWGLEGDHADVLDYDPEWLPYKERRGLSVELKAAIDSTWELMDAAKLRTTIHLGRRFHSFFDELVQAVTLAWGIGKVYDFWTPVYRTPIFVTEMHMHYVDDPFDSKEGVKLILSSGLDPRDKDFVEKIFKLFGLNDLRLHLLKWNRDHVQPGIEGRSGFDVKLLNYAYLLDVIGAVTDSYEVDATTYRKWVSYNREIVIDNLVRYNSTPAVIELARKMDPKVLALVNKTDIEFVESILPSHSREVAFMRNLLFMTAGKFHDTDKEAAANQGRSFDYMRVRIARTLDQAFDVIETLRGPLRRRILRGLPFFLLSSRRILKKNNLWEAYQKNLYKHKKLYYESAAYNYFPPDMGNSRHQ